MNNKRIVLKNIFSSLLQEFVAVIYGFIVPILIIRHYGSEINGLVSSITQFIAYVTLLDFGISRVIKFSFFEPILKKNKDGVEKVLGATKKFFWKMGIIFAVYVLILCFFYPNVVEGFDYWYTFFLILIISIGKFFEFFIGTTYKLFLQADQKNYIVDYTVTITYILNVILVVILINLNCNIHILKIVSSASYIIRPLFLKIYFDKKYGYKINTKANYKLPQRWDGIFHHIASVVQSNTDVVILTLFSNLTNVSIYSVYALITSGIRMVITSLTNGIDAFFGKLMITDNEKVLNDKFEVYKLLFYTFVTIILSSTCVLMVSFVGVYTKDITDANYIQPLFSYIIVFAEFSYVIRLPYANLVYAKGHFKETRNFSLAEPIVNIILSVILVIKYGLIGVALGTLFSMLIRSIGFITYASKNIINVSSFQSFKIIIVSLIEMISVFCVYLLVPTVIINSYIDWFLYALIVFIFVLIFVFIINCLLFKKSFQKVLNTAFKRKIINHK